MTEGVDIFSTRAVVSSTLTKTLSIVWTSAYFRLEIGWSVRNSIGGRVFAPLKSGPSWDQGSEPLIVRERESALGRKRAYGAAMKAVIKLRWLGPRVATAD